MSEYIAVKDGNFRDGALMAVASVDSLRQPNGALTKPVEFFVIRYSEMKDLTEMVPVSWEAINVLAHDRAKRISDALMRNGPTYAAEDIASAERVRTHMEASR